MRFPNPIAEPSTPAGVFMSRYKWLSRWAVQFARNDRAVADDLIQETFLRFSQANLQVAEIRDAEALLYTYLQHVYLAHMREVTHHSFVSLAGAKLDALALGQLTGPDVDRIETQNILRRIAAFVAWRKQTSKSASIVGLRFFHGYLPDEIASIALVSREAVDERLHKGRNEVRLHLLDAEKLRKIQHGGPAEIFPSKVVIPTDEFLGELRIQLSHSPHGACISAEQLAARYVKSPEVPVRRDLLSHLVSCSRCLAVAEQASRHGQHPRAPGGAGRIMRMERRKPAGELPLPSANEMVRRAERRMKEIFEHRPTALIVAVNGEILASRDIRASFNGIKVEVLTRDLKFIEILNEYGVSLLSWAVESTPPHSDPILRRVAEFSMGRRLGVDLHFSAQRLVIEVQYHDPSQGEGTLVSFATLASSVEEQDEEEARPLQTGRSFATAHGRRLLGGWKRFKLTPLIATGFVCAAILAMIFTFRLQRFSRVKPAELLRRAAASETRDVENAQSGVILQRVRIRSRQGEFERSIYRDPEGKRHTKERAMDEKKMRLKKRLAEAGISWDAPLSATSFQEWQAQNHTKSESVQSLSDKLLSLRVETEGSEVEQETLTIRLSDFHPIGRTAEFRDLGTVEIAELNYAVVPWTTIDVDLIDGASRSSDAIPRARRPLQLPQRVLPLSDAELDITELEVRIALHETQADSTDRLTLSRSSTGVMVSGLLEDDTQKLNLHRRLMLIPHVSTDLKTVSDVSQRPDGDSPPASVQITTVIAEPSLLETFLLKHGRTRDVASDLADRFFKSSSTLLRANKALLRLRERFPPGKLTPEAAELRGRLLTSWQSELDAALGEEAEVIHQAGIQTQQDEAARSGPTDMNAGIEENHILVKELMGQGSPGTRTAPMVLTELGRLVESLRTAANQENAKVSQETSPGIPSVQPVKP